jgi:branched-chain amino acid transport system permease protein
VTAALSAGRARWEDISRPARGAIGVLVASVAVFAAYRLPGLGSFLEDKAPFGIVVAGVIVGTVTALLAMGLILIYKTSRFINFAYASMGSLAGVTAIGLHLEKGVPFFAALPIGVVLGVLTGALVELIVRRFRHTSRLILTVASIGIAQVLSVIEAAIAFRALGFVSLTGGFKIPLDLQLDLGVKTLFGDEILIMMVVPPVLAGLAWFLLRTDVGVAVRAAAENEDRALLLGIPIRRLSTIVWMVAGGLAALTFVLKAPFSGVTPGLAGAGPLLLLPALAAAVVARMESLPTAFAAGVGLGVMEAIIGWNTPGSPTVQYVAFLVVILAALLLQSGKLSRAQESATSTWSSLGVLKPIPLELRHLPEVAWARRVIGLLVVLAFIFVPAGWSPSNQYLAAVAIVWGLAAVALVILTGWGGHISLGQFAIVGVGALVAGNLIQHLNLDLFLVLIISGVAGAVVSLVVGLPALRIKGLFLAVTTLAFAVALDQYVLNFNNFPDLIPTDVGRPMLLERFDLTQGHTMYLTCLVFLGLAILAAQGLRKARPGRVMIATRDNQRAADAAAVPTTNVKLAAFLVAGVISGVAGGLHVVIVSSLNPGTYPPSDSLTVFATAVIGGLGSVSGALSGVLLFRFIETMTFLGDVPVLGNIRPLLTGGMLLIVLLVLPGGLGQLIYNLRDRLLRRVAERRGILVPSLVADKRSDGADHAANEVGLLQGALSADEGEGTTAVRTVSTHGPSTPEVDDDELETAGAR